MACPSHDQRLKTLQESESAQAKLLTWLKDSATQCMATLKEVFNQKMIALKTGSIWNRFLACLGFRPRGYLLTLTVLVLVSVMMAFLLGDKFLTPQQEYAPIKATCSPEVAKSQDLVDGATSFAHDSLASVPEKVEGLKASMMAQGRNTLRAIRGQGRSIWDPMTHKVDALRGAVKQVFMAGLESSFKFAMCLIVALAAMMGGMILISNTGTNAADESKGMDAPPPTTNGCVQGCPTFEEWLVKSKVEKSE